LALSQRLLLVLAGFLALLSAATFAFNNASLRRGVLTGTVWQAMFITVPLGLPVFFLAALLSGTLGSITEFSLNSVLLLSGAGVLHFIWGRYCNYRATQAIGTNLTAPIQQVNLIIVLGLAIVVLGETLTPLRVLGIILVLAGPYFAMRSDKKPVAKTLVEEAAAASEVDPETANKPAPFVPKYAEGIIFSLLSATGYGTSPILIRLGLEGKGLSVSIAGGLIAYLASTAVFGLFLFWPGRVRHALAVNRESAKWFTISGVLVSFSQLFLFMAQSIAPVTVVSPIGRLSILFRLYFSRLLNPNHEVFGGQMITGTIISLLGALALSVSVDAVGSYLPAALQPVLQWHWP
jgi:drug/metabolite transporter (DMT)-like permease